MTTDRSSSFVIKPVSSRSFFGKYSDGFVSRNISKQSRHVVFSQLSKKRNAEPERKNWSTNKACLSVQKDQSNPRPKREEAADCQQCDLCDTDYVRYTTQHLHQRIGEHKHSAIGRHLEDYGLSKSDLKDKQFSILRKCRTKFDCLIFEMLFIKELKPGLNTQMDSIRAKLFT